MAMQHRNMGSGWRQGQPDHCPRAPHPTRRGVVAAPSGSGGSDSEL